MRLLWLGCVVAGVAAAVLADRAVALWAESGEVAAAAPKPGEAGAGASVAPAAPSAAEVIAKLLAARSSLGPTQAEFSWVMGPADVTQARYEGRLSVVDATRYRVDFSLAEAVSAENILVVPDGRWAYELSNAENAIGMRVDLVYLKERVRDPAARVLYDPAGGALLELLGQRGYVTYEGDENLDAGRCAVLSYEGGSFRNPQTPGRQTQGEAGVRTRLRYRYEDGLLVSEEELDSRGGARRSYRLLTPHRFEPTPDLLRVPESAHCVDITKQLVRRLLYGPPQPVPGAAAR